MKAKQNKTKQQQQQQLNHFQTEEYLIACGFVLKY